MGAEDVRGELDLCAPDDDSSDTVLHAHAMVILAAVAAGVVPLGNLGTIAAFNDETAVRGWADHAWRMGYRGGFCIHPKQVAIFNEAYRPSESDRQWAREVLAGSQVAAAEGRAVFLIRGRMIDAPLIRRAERILAL
jgi:citrate lyase subunit beta/citryl-CoA lyase